MPLLYCLGAKRAMDKIGAQLQESEQLFAYLDDVYALCKPARVEPVYEAIARALYEENNISLHGAKTRIWNRAGVKPAASDQLGDEVWSPSGVKVLGTPIGDTTFVAAHTAERMEAERELLEAIPKVPDLQSAWQILLHCAGPRCNHFFSNCATAAGASVCGRT